MTHVLFVCTGNTCRSPLAEALARREADRTGVRLTTGSAGSRAARGEPATPAAVRVGGRRGADLTTHRSRPLSLELLAGSDLVVAMTESHLRSIRALAPDVPALLATDLLGEGDDRRGEEVPDPFGGDELAYEAVADVLQSCVAALVESLSLDRPTGGDRRGGIDERGQDA